MIEQRGSGPERTAASVAERVRARSSRDSQVERRIARALLASYPAAGLDTARRLADVAGVSTASVVRYVAALGFEGYRDFQDALRAELADRQFSPLSAPAPAGMSTSELRAGAARRFASAVESSLAALPDEEVEAAARLLVDPKRRVTTVGGRFSHVLAEYLQLHLRLLRSQTRHLRVMPEEIAPFLMDVGPRDVLVVFDYRRYQRDVIEVARESRRRGASIVLFTDPWMSPAAGHASIVLPSRVEGASPFDSFVAAMAAVETLLAAVLERAGASAERRMRDIDAQVGDVLAD